MDALTLKHTTGDLWIECHFCTLLIQANNLWLSLLCEGSGEFRGLRGCLGDRVIEYDWVIVALAIELKFISSHSVVIKNSRVTRSMPSY